MVLKGLHVSREQPNELVRVNKQRRPLADQSGEMKRRRPGLVEFERLYERDFYAFVRVARAIVGDAQLAVDAVHDGFASAIRGRDGFRGDGPFEA